MVFLKKQNEGPTARLAVLQGWAKFFQVALLRRRLWKEKSVGKCGKIRIWGSKNRFQIGVELPETKSCPDDPFGHFDNAL